MLWMCVDCVQCGAVTLQPTPPTYADIQRTGLATLRPAPCTVTFMVPTLCYSQLSSLCGSNCNSKLAEEVHESMSIMPEDKSLQTKLCLQIFSLDHHILSRHEPVNISFPANCAVAACQTITNSVFRPTSSSLQTTHTTLPH